MSDHFHPWVDRQGHAPFVWSVLGALAVETDALVIGTGVTCPTLSLHPAIVGGPDPTVHVEAITAFAKSGVDHVCIHQVGPRQDQATEFYEREVMPLLELEPGASLGPRVEARR